MEVGELTVEEHDTLYKEQTLKLLFALQMMMIQAAHQKKTIAVIQWNKSIDT